MDIAEFLLARTGEDEAVARAVQTPGVWVVSPVATAGEANVVAVEQGPHGVRVVAYDGETNGACSASDAEHIARHDPARVLAECEAKRRIVELHRPPIREPETDGDLHARSAHPAWEYATTEGPRKQWDDADVPPEGDGWTRNVDAGRDGWERFDYTEESYWRRLRPAGPQTQVEPLTLRLLALPYAEHPDYQPEWNPMAVTS